MALVWETRGAWPVSQNMQEGIIRRGGLLWRVLGFLTARFRLATAWAEVQFRPEKGVWEVVQSDTSSHPDAMNSPKKEMVLGLCTFGLWIGVVLRSG